MRIDRESEVELLIAQGTIQDEYVKEPEAVRALIVEERHRFLVSFWQICAGGGAFFTVLNAGEQKMVWLGAAGTLLALVLMSATMIFDSVIEAWEIRKRGRKVEARCLCTTEAIKGRKWLWYEFELEDGKHICAGNQCITLSEIEEQKVFGQKKTIWYAEGQYDMVADISGIRILKEYRASIISGVITVILSGVFLWMAVTMKTF